jgi:tryptophanyl-tRNA synthetase
MDLQAPENKMSKSAAASGGGVCLMDRPEDILRAFKRAVTDSGAQVRFDPESKPGVSNLMEIYAVCSGKTLPDVEREFSGRGYGDFKKAVGEAVVETLRPMREEAERLLKDRAHLEKICADGARRAALTADKTLRSVYEKLGFVAKPALPSGADANTIAKPRHN